MLWIGEEGKVYSAIVVMDSVVGVTVDLASMEEGCVGFLLQGGEYRPVICRNATWVLLCESEIRTLYNSEIDLWAGSGMQMPYSLREMYSQILNRI